MIAAAVFAAFPTQQYNGDGLRWYGTIAGYRGVELGGSNHLLYPIVARLWFASMRSIGIPESWALAQAMNSVFAGIAVAAFASILHFLTGSLKLAASGALTLALSRAFSVHATDMTEPMPGAALSLCAMWVVVRVLARGHNVKRIHLLIAGAMVGLAAALYQTNVLTVIGCSALLLLWPHSVAPSYRLKQCLLMGLAAAGVSLVVFVGAFMMVDGHTPGEALRHTLTTENHLTQGIYSEISLRRVGVLIFGLGDAFFGLRGIEGQGAAFFTNATVGAIALALITVLWSVLAITLPVWLARRQLFSRSAIDANSQLLRRVVFVMFIWLLPQFGLLVFFGARYSKLWILPLAGLIAIVTLLAQLSTRSSARASYWLMLVLPVCLAGLAANVLPDHFRPNPAVEDAREIVRMTRDRDLIISDWGGLPYEPVPRMRTFTVIGTAFTSQLDAALVSAKMVDEMRAAAHRGGDVYVLGLLDLSAPEWETFLGARIRLPYSFLDEFRFCSRAVYTLSTRTPTGNPTRLWKVQCARD